MLFHFKLLQFIKNNQIHRPTPLESERTCRLHGISILCKGKVPRKMQLTKIILQRKNLRGHYRNPNGTLTNAAIRARSPYAAKNALVGLSLLSFCGFCYWWAYKSFTPDDFADVPMPPISEEDLERLKKQVGK